MNRNFEVSTRTVKFNGKDLTEITTTLVNVAIRDAYSNPDLYKETDTPDHLEKLIEALVTNQITTACEQSKSFSDILTDFEVSYKELLNAFLERQTFFDDQSQDKLRSMFSNVEAIITTFKQTTIQFKNEKA